MKKRMQIFVVCVLMLLGTVGCSQPSVFAASGITRKAPKTQTTFQNPVISSNFADPSVLHAGHMYYAYATNSAGKHIQVASSSDLVNWTQLPDAMPTLPSWTNPNGSFVWAPDVIQVGNTYNMYYTARDIQSNKQCVGVATSDSPQGPFQDSSNSALVCQASQGGTIDPSPFYDGNNLYLYFKNDGNCCGMPTYLYAQQLAPDGLSITGNPIPLMHNDQPWEGKVTEAPNMFKHNSMYYLFFSANNYANETYAVGYATCQTPLGPCQQAAENPILSSQLMQQPPVIGPGGQTVFQVGCQTWMVYHVWNVTPDGQRGNSRYMWLDRVNWANDKPQVQGPTTGPQPVPHIP